jgi:hypothetical protein
MIEISIEIVLDTSRVVVGFVMSGDLLTRIVEIAGRIVALYRPAPLLPA